MPISLSIDDRPGISEESRAQLPRIVIAGRPNVGKSTLFNRLTGRRHALVDDTPGMTRDWREGEGRLLDLVFTLIDTAGIEDYHTDSLEGRMRRMTEDAIMDADIILFVIDTRTGLMPADRDLAHFIRKSGKNMILLANKAEAAQSQDAAVEAYELGLGDPLPFSAEHGLGLDLLYDHLKPMTTSISEKSDPVTAEDSKDQDRPLRLAIVGRPNAGKSTLMNRLLGQDRVLTGPEAGITRDAIAADYLWRGRKLRLMDTAGLRRKARVDDKPEKLAALDSLRIIRFAEVVVLLVDSTRGLEAQDLKIANMVENEGRILILGLSKWDLVDNGEDNGEQFQSGIRKALDDAFSQIKKLPIIRLSGLTGAGINRMLEDAFALRDSWSKRVPTGQINRWFERALAHKSPPSHKGRAIKLRYITQAQTRPPTFIVFGNRTEHMEESYRRYLANSLARHFGLEQIPLRIVLRSSKNPYLGVRS